MGESPVDSLVGGSEANTSKMGSENPKTTEIGYYVTFTD